VVVVVVALLQVDLLQADLLPVGPIQVGLLPVDPIQGMRFLGILLLVVLLRVNFHPVLAGLLRIVCFDPIRIFGLAVLRLVGLVCLISLLSIELRCPLWSCVQFRG
jgi:hypothetical protein